MRQEAEFNVEDFEDENQNKGVYARFYLTPKVDEAKSADAGRPIFKEVEYIEIIAAGNASNIIRRPARDEERRRFHREYAKFKAGDMEQVVGTPLREVPWLTREQVEELLYRKVTTLEQLAALSDGACNAPGMFELKRKAAAWLEKAKEAAPFTKMIAEMEGMRAEIEALKAQLTAKPAAAAKT